MKRKMLFVLIIACLLACHGNNVKKTADSIKYEPTALSIAEFTDCIKSTPLVIPTQTIIMETAATPETTTFPLCMVNNKNNMSDLGIQMDVTDGKRYGCDIVCWFDGFGYCYNVKDAENSSCEIRLSPKLSSFEVFSEGYSHQEAYIDSGYGVYLTTETRTYRIGFLRVLNKPHIYGYGTFFELLVEDDPQVDLFPVEPQCENQWGDNAAWFECEQKDGRLLMYPTKYTWSDTCYDEVDGAKGEPYPIEITDETVIMICFFDSEWPYMIVSEERMMRLVRDGYFMEYPCWVYVSDGKLIAARQIMYE